MDVLKPFENYIKEILGFTPETEALPKSELKSLPFFYNESYHFYKWNFQNKSFILMSPSHQSEDITPAELSKQANLAARHLLRVVILLLPAMASFNRLRLITYKTPFVVPGKQMYLPDLLIDLREHFTRLRGKIGENMTPSAQAVLLYCIINRKYGPMTNGEFSEKLKYSRMTLNRAFDELESFELAKNKAQGRDKIICFEYKGRDLWNKAISLMRSPIKKKVFLKSLPRQQSFLRKAGISALSEKTMISGDETQVFALGNDDYKFLIRNDKTEEAGFPEEAGCAVEIWKYSPCVLSAKSETVDPLSLFLSLRNEHDERIQGALEELMEGFQW
jgi:hypothetical protein